MKDDGNIKREMVRLLMAALYFYLKYYIFIMESG